MRQILRTLVVVGIAATMRVGVLATQAEAKAEGHAAVAHHKAKRHHKTERHHQAKHHRKAAAAASTTTSTTTTAPPPAPTAPAPATNTAPPPATNAAPTNAAPAATCSPIDDLGGCYEPGEYCRDATHGVSGTAGDGEAITCETNDGWRWEPA